VAHAWHSTFEKYAAAQLNKRYRDSFATPMVDEAWAGWAAVKIVSDTVARTQSAAPAALREALRGAIAFDGQKGVEMDFRADGQLRQPLLLIHEDTVVGEAPVRGVAEVEDLDSLGTGACKP
jgi:ABC transporter substrate binding protein (PQQ-dependent alcohol dehydrogenase system)